MSRRLIRRLRRWLYIGHRWIGIVTCLLFVMWVVSGVVMMYVAFPRLTEQERLSALPDIEWSKVAVTPDRAMAIVGLKRYPRELRLDMLDDEPVYRIAGWDGERKVVSARDGRVIGSVTPQQALAVARQHPAAADARLIETVDRDQWSVTARFDPSRPLFLIALGDAASSEVEDISSAADVFCWVTLSSCWMAVLICAAPAFCSRAPAEISSTRSAVRLMSGTRRASISQPAGRHPSNQSETRSTP